MNNARRKLIFAEVRRIEEAVSRLENIKSEEEDVFESMPENLQYSERGEISQDAIESLETTLDLLGKALEALDEIN